MMFAQANSEHCRHKIFNADWIIDGRKRDESLFAMIRYTHARSPHGVLSHTATTGCDRRQPRHTLFSESAHGHLWRCGRADRHSDEGRDSQPSNRHLAIPGASTGSGEKFGTRRHGSRRQTKAGLTGFSVSNLRIPGYERPWEAQFGKPSASPPHSTS